MINKNRIILKTIEEMIRREYFGSKENIGIQFPINMIQNKLGFH